MSEQPSIVVFGDPILDVFYLGTMDGLRFTPKKTTNRNGGAVNTLLNVVAVLPEGYPVIDKVEGLGSARLIRHCDLNGVVLHEFWADKPSSQFAWALNNTDVAIFSDYGHGSLTARPGSMVAKHKLAVVDSKRRTFDTSYLEKTETKIWRCTGDEYDETWAKNFDWIVITDGASNIYIRQGIRPGVGGCLIVPTIDVVDACGAGDTFTAALGSYLLMHSLSPNLDELMLACEFARMASQDVCMQKFTAVTNITLR
jgi:sugar/nucleoside kinase (ribokinase family)